MRSYVPILLLLGAGCASKEPAPRAELTPRPATLAGRRAAERLERTYGGVLRDRNAESTMERLGRRLLREPGAIPNGDATPQYRLLDSPEMNAFSLPDDRIYITRALYQRIQADADVLSAVLAHEFAHLEAGDSLKPRPTSSAEALHRELTADARSVEILRAAHIPPHAAHQLVQLVSHDRTQSCRNSRLDRLSLFCRH